MSPEKIQFDGEKYQTNYYNKVLEWKITESNELSLFAEVFYHSKDYFREFFGLLIEILVFCDLKSILIFEDI
jgi:hypothetical protein